MDTKLLLLLIAVTSVLAYSDETKKNIDNSDDEDYDYTYDDDSNEEISEKSEAFNTDIGNTIKETTSEQNNVKLTPNETTLKPATYEVTENVVDIPDNSTRRGPVIINFTTPLPLNNANVVNTGNKDQSLNSNGNPIVNYGFMPPVNNANVPNTIGDPNNVPFNHKPDYPDNNYGFVDIDNEAAKTKKNYFSIFHVKAEYDDKPSAPNIDHTNERPSGFKEYILGLKRGIVNGLYKLFNKKQSQEETQESASNHHEGYLKYPESHSNRFGHTKRYYEHEEYD